MIKRTLLVFAFAAILGLGLTLDDHGGRREREMRREDRQEDRREAREFEVRGENENRGRGTEVEDLNDDKGNDGVEVEDLNDDKGNDGTEVEIETLG